MKNTPLTINNYLLKYNDVTVIHTIYTYMEVVVLLVVFERQTNEVSGWCSLSMLINFSASEAFVGEAFVHGEISFLILLSSVWTSDIFSLLTKKKHLFSLRIPLRTNIPNWLTNHRSFSFLLLLFDWSANQMH